MKCRILSKDLMFSSQISGTVGAVGIEASTVSTVDGIATGLSPADAYFVILDLNFPASEVASVVRQLREQSPPPTKVLAIGPHVHEAKLTAATAAGCDRVLSKGEASRGLAGVLAEMALIDPA